MEEFIDDCFADSSPSILDRYIEKNLYAADRQARETENFSAKEKGEALAFVAKFNWEGFFAIFWWERVNRDFSSNASSFDEVVF